jgi:P27 family predicted phage terminase small subunit
VLGGEAGRGDGERNVQTDLLAGDIVARDARNRSELANCPPSGPGAGCRRASPAGEGGRAMSRASRGATVTEPRPDPSSGPRPPAHLAAAGRDLWARVVGMFDLDPHHVPVLLAACEARDRAESCRQRIKREGATFTDRWGQPRPHPLLTVERDARAAMVRCLHGLGLDVVAPGAVGRPPGR